MIDISDYADVSDGSPVNGKVQRYDSNFAQPMTSKDLILSVTRSIADWVSPESRENRDHELDKQRLAHKGELSLVQKGIEADLLDAEIDNQKHARLAVMAAGKEVTQQEIRDRNDVALTEYQEAKALESQKKEVDAKQIKVDAMKMDRQLREVEELGLSPQDEEYEKERIRRVWKEEAQAQPSRSPSKRR